MVRSLSICGLRTDVPFKAQYDWMSTWGLAGTTLREARVAEVRLGEHDGFFVINGRIKATFEHPFLARRGDAWGFCSAELLQVGDYLITFVAGELDEEPIVSLERADAPVRTVRLHVPGTNTFLADGAWTHNDASRTGGSFSEGSSSSSSSSSSKSSGSSFSGSASPGSSGQSGPSGGASGVGHL
jgi:hypothetical protein